MCFHKGADNNSQSYYFPCVWVAKFNNIRKYIVLPGYGQIFDLIAFDENNIDCTLTLIITIMYNEKKILTQTKLVLYNSSK